MRRFHAQQCERSRPVFPGPRNMPTNWSPFSWSCSALPGGVAPPSPRSTGHSVMPITPSHAGPPPPGVAIHTYIETHGSPCFLCLSDQEACVEHSPFGVTNLSSRPQPKTCWVFLPRWRGGVGERVIKYRWIRPVDLEPAAKSVRYA